MGEKIQISQDELYQFMKEHNIIITRLGEMIGLKIDSMSACFKHMMANGKPRWFTKQTIAKINKSLPQMAFEIESRRLVFNYSNNIGKQNKSMFDPSCVGQLKTLGTYFKVDAMCQRVLRWKEVSSRKILFAPSSTMYGHITPENVNAINEEILFVSFWLQRHEILANENVE